MKKEKMNKRKISVLIAVTVLAIAVVVSVKLLMPKKVSSTIDRNYAMSVKIDAVKEDDTKEVHTIEVVNLKNVSKIKGDFYPRNIYVKDGRTIFDDGGKYKFFEGGNTLRDLYSILRNVTLKDEVSKHENDKVYNPELDNTVINAVLEALFIDRTTDRTERVTIEVTDNKLKSVSLYLVGLKGYKGMNVVMTFRDVTKKDEFDVPIFYEELMEKTDKKEVMMITD